MRHLLNRTFLIVTGVLGISKFPLYSQELIYGMTAANSVGTSAGLALVRFNSTTPGTVTTISSFSGVASGQSLRSIDFQPSSGQLFAISTNNAAGQLYTVNLATAALTPVGTGFTLTGNFNNVVSMGFNPVTNEIRVVTRNTTNNNYRISPLTGALIAQDTDMAYIAGDPNAGAPPAIVAIAHTNHMPGASSTTLYAWDFKNDALVTVGGPAGKPSPNGGTLSTVNTPTGFLTSNSAVGMSISSATGILYVTHDDPVSGTTMSLYTRNLATGAETFVGAYPSGTFVADISVFVPVPEPASVLAGVAGMLCAAAIVLRRFVSPLTGKHPTVEQATGELDGP
jgi:hypothetical protein